MTVTVAQLGARALRKIGIAIVAPSSAPAPGPVSTAADVALGVLRNLGIVVPEAERPAGAGVVTVADLAARALRAVGVNPVDASVLGGTTFTQAQIATAALQKLAVIASDEAPTPLDLAAAEDRVAGVHDLLAGLHYVTWTIDRVPSTVSEYYVLMVSNLLAPQFGKPAALDAFAAAQEAIRRVALAGEAGKALAQAKVLEVHEALNAAGLVAWTVDAVPVAHAQAYVAMAAVLLGPVMGHQQDAPSRQIDRAEWDAAEASLRRAGIVRGALARATDHVRSVAGELAGLGLASWDADHIPQNVGDAVEALATLQMGPEFGKPLDDKVYGEAVARARRILLGGPAGQALAEQKVRAVHFSLEARGKVRWILWDIPPFAEEIYVAKAAVLLGPECGVKVDPAWDQQAEAELARIVSLPSAGEPVQAEYF